MSEKKRCGWAWGDENSNMVRYHDNEWGKPCHDERELFELLILEGMQAGISWSIVLNKREAFREAMDNFDYNKIKDYDETKVAELLQNPGIIRAKAKINAAITNAKAFIQIQEEFGSFDKYIWGFTDGKTLVENEPPVPTKTPLSEAISADMKKRGIKFCGPVIVYSYLQAIGIINAHDKDCFCCPIN